MGNLKFFEIFYAYTFFVAVGGITVDKECMYDGYSVCHLLCPLLNDRLGAPAIRDIGLDEFNFGSRGCRCIRHVIPPYVSCSNSLFPILRIVP